MTGVTAVAAGAAHTCAVLAGGAVTCWGAGAAGQLGQGSVGAAADLLAPGAAIALPAAATAVTAGADFSCALLADGRVSCWGDGARGQLGLGDTARPRRAGGRRGAGREGDRGWRPAIITSARCSRITPSPAGARTTAASSASATPRTDRSRWRSVSGRRAWPLSPPASTRPASCSKTARLAVGSGAGARTTVASWASATPRRGARRRRRPSISEPGATPPRCPWAGRSPAPCSIPRRRNAGATTRPPQLGAPLRGPAYGDEPNETGDFLPVVPQGGGRAVRALASGRGHSCAILDTGDVRCWGDNGYGQLGAGDANEHSPFLDPTGVVDLGGAP